jgi:hypothetical protein
VGCTSLILLLQQHASILCFYDSISCLHHGVIVYPGLLQQRDKPGFSRF